MALPVGGPTRRSRRRALERGLAVLVIAAGLVLWDVAPAAACSCVHRERSAKLERSDVVFTGTVIEKRVSRPMLGSDDPAVWVFDVDAVYKGTAAARQGVVSAREGASCGLELTLGARALVFAFRKGSTATSSGGGTLSSGLCDGSRSIFSASEITPDLGQARPPDAGESGVETGPLRGRGPLVLLAVGIAAPAAVLAVTAARRRRRRAPRPAA